MHDVQFLDSTQPKVRRRERDQMRRYLQSSSGLIHSLRTHKWNPDKRRESECSSVLGGLCPGGLWPCVTDLFEYRDSEIVTLVVALQRGHPILVPDYTH